MWDSVKIAYPELFSFPGRLGAEEIQQLKVGDSVYILFPKFWVAPMETLPDDASGPWTVTLVGKQSTKCQRIANETYFIDQIPVTNLMERSPGGGIFRSYKDLKTYHAMAKRAFQIDALAYVKSAKGLQEEKLPATLIIDGKEVVIPKMAGCWAYEMLVLVKYQYLQTNPDTDWYSTGIYNI